MSKNPQGFQFHTLPTESNKQINRNGSKRGTPVTSSKNNSAKNLNYSSKSKKTKEEEDAENDIGSYANLIYGTIKNFFSGVIEIKGNLFKLTIKMKL
jgi:hypothetical protein